MKSLLMIQQDIDALVSEKLEIEKEGEAIDALKESYRSQDATEKRPLSQLDLWELGDRSIKYRQKINTINHELRALELLKNILSLQESPTFERIVIGGGIAATMVYNEMPPVFRDVKQRNG